MQQAGERKACLAVEELGLVDTKYCVKKYCSILVYSIKTLHFARQLSCRDFKLQVHLENLPFDLRSDECHMAEKKEEVTMAVGGDDL